MVPQRTGRKETDRSDRDVRLLIGRRGRNHRVGLAHLLVLGTFPNTGARSRVVTSVVYLIKKEGGTGVPPLRPQREK